ncbi:MAG: hypothetical protein AABX23_01460 [Nanoarchaeota archaeon]
MEDEPLITRREIPVLKRRLLGWWSSGYRSYSEIQRAFCDVLGLERIDLDPYLKRTFVLPNNKTLSFYSLEERKDRYWVFVL